MAKNVVKKLQEKGADIEALVLMLNKAYADELLAYHQYLSPIGLCIGKLRPDVEAEFKEHAEEELKHAEMLKQRIIELDGVPLQSPQELVLPSGTDHTRGPRNQAVLVAGLLKPPLKNFLL